MFLWSFENGLQQKQSSFSIVPAIQSSSLRLPTSSLLLSKSSCDFPGLSASPSWGLNLLLQIFFFNSIFSSAQIHHVHFRRVAWQSPQLVVHASAWAWHGWGRLSIAFLLLHPWFSSDYSVCKLPGYYFVLSLLCQQVFVYTEVMVLRNETSQCSLWLYFSQDQKIW